MTEVIEGTAVEIVPAEVRAVAVVQQPGQVIVSGSADPELMVGIASRLATVLKDIVDRQRLYADIKGKRYPTVEAWMTIARLDNVVAREPVPPVRHDDGSYEAFAEIVRLSDGMVIGASSALCGTKDDAPWNGRSEPARRSMAQTRATSRAFRQQYSWIMALAGYEPTPAEEMPTEHGTPPRHPQDTPAETPSPLATMGITGKAIVKPDKRSQDFELRQTPDGMSLGFRLEYGGTGVIVECVGPLADQMAFFRDAALSAPITVYGDREPRSFPSGERTVNYEVLRAARILVEGVGDLPALPSEMPTVPMFADADGKVDDLSDLPW